METKVSQKILFVVNPVAGFIKNADYTGEISHLAGIESFDYKIYRTTGENDSEQIRKLVQVYQPEKVIVVGGDGTFNMVATELIGSNINLGIVPSGSANGLAFNLNIPARFRNALEINMKAPFKPMDAICINHEHYCFHLSDIGINARIVKRFEKEKTRGMLGYGKQFFKELFSPKTYFSFHIETEDKKRRLKAEMIVIANAQSFGTGVIINQDGKINDGRFEVVVIKPYPWWFVFTFIFAGFTRNLHRMEAINVYPSEKAKITLEKPQDFQIDGEVIGKIKNLEIEILPHAINIVHT